MREVSARINQVFALKLPRLSDIARIARNVKRNGQIEMENQVNETIEQQAEENSSLLTNRVFTDAYALQVAEQVLTNIEQTQLKAPAKSYDLKKVRTMLSEYKSSLSDESGEALQIEFRVLQELHFWRSSLARRDELVKTFHLRRFYDENVESVTAQMLAALGCFYRSLMPSYEVRSKYDFVLTQLFSSKLPGKPRYVRIVGDELIERLQRFNVVWTGIEIDWADEKTRRAREDAIAVFESFRREVADFNRLEDLLKSKFFERIRRHKQYLGESFFAPEVTAASIRCNVEVGNKFAQLVAEENESFRQALESEHGGADVLGMVLEENPAHSINLLKQINPDFEFSAEESETVEPETTTEFESEKPSVFTNDVESDVSVRNLDEQAETSAEVSESRTEFPRVEDISGDDNRSLEFLCEKFDLTRDSTADFLQVLSEISKREPTENVLREYLSTSQVPEVSAFDFSLYLRDVEETSQNEIDLKRRALRLIFVAEDYQRRLLNESDSSPDEEEIRLLKNEIQSVISDLRETGGKLTGANRKERGNVLLNAVNDLFQARSRLISASSQAQRSQGETSGHCVSVDEKAKKYQHFDQIAPNPKPFESNNNKSPNANRGLIALTILVVLFGVSYFFYQFAVETPEAQKVEISNVRDVNVNSLRGGERLLVARISNNTLIGVVTPTWSGDIIESKREVLQLLLGQGTEFQYKTVLLFNSKGEIVGNATAREIIAK
ncbi:MAG: hypothetical protein M3209_02480 [Acidobacteriota bacterium]|nr:hypothetical protein [Acidobacteriota bacterium]